MGTEERRENARRNFAAYHEATRAKVQEARIIGDIAIIPLTRGFEAVVDAEDVPYLSQFPWRALTSEGHTYAVRTEKLGGKYCVIYMHRSLVHADKNVQVDHRDNDGLNNRKKNLRWATHSENGMNSVIPKNNTTGFKGVYKNRQTGGWFAAITFGGKKKYLGQHKTPEAAHAAYCAAAKELHGDFARFK